MEISRNVRASVLKMKRSLQCTITGWFLFLQGVRSAVVSNRVLIVLGVAPLELSVLPIQNALLQGEQLECEPWSQLL